MLFTELFFNHFGNIFTAEDMGILALIISFSLYSLTQSQSSNDDIRDAVALIDQLRGELRRAFDASGKHKPLLATTVRLIFHDCTGPVERSDNDNAFNSICNGCINFANDENLGLRTGAIQPLELIYLSYKNDMSRADFWSARYHYP